MSEVLSWDLCDHLCKNLIIKLDYYEDFIFNWIAADHIYKKRASFVLIAASTIHDKSMTKETLDIYLKLVYETFLSHIQKEYDIDHSVDEWRLPFWNMNINQHGKY